MGKDLKGISPLVAVIMLIAFTMVVAGILASWASQFATTQRQQIQICSKAELFMQKGIYNNASQNLELYVWNSGTVPLSGFTVLLTHQNGTPESRLKSNVNITAGSIETLSLSDIPSNIKQVVVRSNECRGAQDMLLSYDIQGMS